MGGCSSSKLMDISIFTLLRRLPGAGMAQAAMGGMVQKAQSAAQQAVAQAAAKEVEKQMSNAFSAGMQGLGRKK